MKSKHFNMLKKHAVDVSAVRHEMLIRYYGMRFILTYSLTSFDLTALYDEYAG